MAIQVLTASSFPVKSRDVGSALYVDFKQGKIKISRILCELLGINSAADKVVFAQDDEDESEWYIGKAKASEDAFTLCELKNDKQYAYRVYNSGLCKRIAASVAYVDEGAVLVPCPEKNDEEGRVFYNLLTAVLKNK